MGGEGGGGKRPSPAYADDKSGPGCLFGASIGQSDLVSWTERSDHFIVVGGDNLAG